MRPEDWDARYAERGAVTALEPNRFVAAEAGGQPPGRALDVACGEGRNAVWLAEHGWRVTGIDFSTVAIERARALAAERGVQADFAVRDVLATTFEAEAYDLVLVAYLQLPEVERRTVISQAAAALAPGGRLILVAHDLRNLAEGYGGPSSPSVHWTVRETADEVAAHGLDVERAEEALRDVEGAPRPAIDTLVVARRGARRPPR